MVSINHKYIYVYYTQFLKSKILLKVIFIFVEFLIHINIEKYYFMLSVVEFSFFKKCE